ncbi:DNA polymerase alpha/epsilon, subunit B [Ascosphaera apis ARSEF 7405]|uniref:DNA polymerase epsilon subunit B n=1 Tax=Ascosphaera apis ARSEF 7405 TaxID=392613 RepID=A0A168A539_9EURO|nr:DNA polymerase alpha/epsilon, subunit B [Ascosphaera apis ARSEF 7405]
MNVGKLPGGKGGHLPQLPDEDNAAFSSSPGFATPAHPIISRPITSRVSKTSPKQHGVLPVLLPPSILRPIAFRVLTKKHNLTINSATLQTLAIFVGKHCGSKWRESGSAERVLEDVAKIWKANGYGAIVEDGEDKKLTSILKGLGGSESSSGKSVDNRSATTRNAQFRRTSSTASALQSRRSLQDRSQSFTNGDELEDNDDPAFLNARSHITVINAFEQQRLTYNVNKMHFDIVTSRPSIFATPSDRTAMFRDRYNLIHQRLLRNDVFYTSSFTYQRLDSNFSDQGDFHASKLTQIANLLGRSGSSHYVLGMLARSPAGGILLSDLTGSVLLDLHHARSVPDDGSWYAPGMFIIAYGVYEEDEVATGEGLANNHGVGGAIGGKFFAVFIAGPPCERRENTMGVLDPKNPKAHVEGGFGWVDFLGLGSERGIGPQMRQLEKRCFQKTLSSPKDNPSMMRKVVILSEVNLDSLSVISALERVLHHYDDNTPVNIPPVFVILGNFIQYPGMSGSDSEGSTDYKELFDSLASTLSRFPDILRNSTFVFVPGDNDPWPATQAGGASVPIPRSQIPAMFTSRVNRAFSEANRDGADYPGRIEGKAIWTSNPARLCMFGPTKEIVIFRDDMSGRLRRNAVLLKGASDDQEADGDAMDVEVEREELNNVDGISSLPQQNGSKENVTPTTPASKSQPLDGLTAPRKLVKTVLDQGHLSPFPLNVRPILGSFGSVLNLYPLPSALILADSETDPFALTYEGCHVMNPGRLVPEGSKGIARWIEYDIAKNRGSVIQEKF